ncbi:MAG: MotA/TolQ/ExbB proton channel family protein [Planctomycetes bacterium]|nr:MotA/TolQ/ExbB proton channel family protein [Planctomycetota bacterium]
MMNTRKPNWSGVSRFISLVLFCFYLTGSAEAQSTLDNLREHLDAQNRQSDGVRDRLRKQLQAEKNLRREFAQELFDLEREKLRLQDKIDKAQQEFVDLTNASNRLTSVSQHLADTFQSTAEQLSIYLSEIPTAQEYRVVVEKFLDQPDQTVWAFDPLWTVIDRLHQQAGAITVEETSIHTAGGQLEPVKLVSIGHIAFAYQTQKNGRIGFALGSPNDAEGFRWSEELKPHHKNALSKEINRSRNSGNRISTLPLDISRQLTVEGLFASNTVLARIRAGGPVMVPLFLVAFLAMILILERHIFFFRQRDHVKNLPTHVLQASRRTEYEKAQELCQQSGGVVGRTLFACLNRRQNGPHAMEDSIQEQLLYEAPRLQRFLGGIIALGAVAPLLGLLGTVTGIIKTFAIIKTYSNNNPALLAGGISEALVTTATGLIIAIPILLIHRVLTAQADKLISDAEKNAATLLNALAEEN